MKYISSKILSILYDNIITFILSYALLEMCIGIQFSYIWVLLILNLRMLYSFYTASVLTAALISVEETSRSTIITGSATWTGDAVGHGRSTCWEVISIM